jgi:hypothetical protein
MYKKITDNIDYENDIEEVDSSWIDEFEKIDKEYKDYYTEDLTFIKFHCIYINKANEIEKITEEKNLLSIPGILSKEEIIALIKHNVVCNNIKYSLLSILKFNINIDPIFLKTFIKGKNSAAQKGDIFLQSIKNIETIKFEKCISMFHDLNDLLIIFYEKDRSKNYHNRLDSSTRKIFINSNSFKKTKRNIFKDNIT